MKLWFKSRRKCDSNQFKQTLNTASWRHLIRIKQWTWFESQPHVIRIKCKSWLEEIIQRKIPIFSRLLVQIVLNTWFKSSYLTSKFRCSNLLFKPHLLKRQKNNSRLKKGTWLGIKLSKYIESWRVLMVQFLHSRRNYNNTRMRIKYKHTNIKWYANNKYANKL